MARPVVCSSEVPRYVDVPVHMPVEQIEHVQRQVRGGSAGLRGMNRRRGSAG